MILYRIVNEFGTNTIAAFTAAVRLDFFAMLPAMNLSIGLSSFVAQNLGASLPERVKKGHRATLLMGAAVSVVTTILLFTLGRPLDVYVQ